MNTELDELQKKYDNLQNKYNDLKPKYDKLYEITKETPLNEKITTLKFQSVQSNIQAEG